MRKWAAGPSVWSRRRCHRRRRETGAEASRLRRAHAGDRRRPNDRLQAGAHAADAARSLHSGRSALRSNAPGQARRPGTGGSGRQTPMRGRTQAGGGSRVDDALLRRMAAVIVDEVGPDRVIRSGLQRRADEEGTVRRGRGRLRRGG